jgi:hypothetical protein
MSDTNPGTDPRWSVDQVLDEDLAPEGGPDICGGDVDRTEGMDGVLLPDPAEVAAVGIDPFDEPADPEYRRERRLEGVPDDGLAVEVAPDGSPA